MQESKLMDRRSWLWIALALSACHSQAPLPNLFPSTVANVWHRTGLTNPSASEAPDPVPRTTIAWLQIATYEGPGKLEARVYGLSSPGVALDMVQRWRASANTVFFYRGRNFVVIKWQEADRKALQAFVSELETHLGKDKEQAD
jgi:hypothetical protein